MNKTALALFICFILAGSSTLAYFFLTGDKTAGTRYAHTGQYLNAELVNYAKSYPNASMIRQSPKAQMSKSYGILNTIYYEGRPAFETSTPGYAYCSGLVFQAYMNCRQKTNPAPDYLGIGRSTVFEFRRKFYGVDGNPRTMVDALINYDLGEEVSSLADALPGDLVQFWRNNGSGHSVIYLGGKITPDRKPLSIHYWSIQKDGLKENEEPIGSAPREIDPKRIYIVRAYAK